MITGDGAYIKKINRSIILKEIIEHGKISRADLSKITGLNKATISVQVAALLEEELIYETQPEHNVVGRRPIMLSINGEAGYVLGIDLDYKEIEFILSDLSGNPVHSRTIELPSENYEEIIQILLQHIKEYVKQGEKSYYGLINITIGIHGTVNKNEEVFFIPRYQWRNKNIKEDLSQEIDVPIYIENNANLSTYAEKVFVHHRSHNILTMILSSGIGAGILVDDVLHKGYHGFAGEMGHMIIVADGLPCKCGNRGCWEQYASEPVLLQRLAEELNMPSLNHEQLRGLIAEGNETAEKHMDQFITYTAIGLNNVINIYNPETIVLNSEVLELYPDAVEKIKSKLTSSVSQYRELVLSKLGRTATALGACAFSIQKFFEVPELILEMEQKQLKEAGR